MGAAEERSQEYREAYSRWQRDLERLHRVLLAGEAMDAMHRIALLRSESHSFDRYVEARRRLLGLPDAEAGASSPFGPES